MKRILFSIVCISLLTACFANAEVSDKNAQLIKAAKDGDLQAVQIALANDANVNVRDKDGIPVLMWAANNNRTEVVKLLLGKGADVNVKDTYEGATALLWASQRGYAEVVKLLLSAKADVNAKAKNGNTPLSIAKERGYTDIVQLLEKAGAIEAKIEAKNAQLIKAVKGSKALSEGAEPNAKDEEQDFLAAKNADDPDACLQFVRDHPASTRMRVFEGKVEFGGTPVGAGDGKWAQQYYLKPVSSDGEIIILSEEEAVRWKLINVIGGRVLGAGVKGAVIVYAEPSPLVSIRKETCWHILALQRASSTVPTNTDKTLATPPVTEQTAKAIQPPPSAPAAEPAKKATNSTGETIKGQVVTVTSLDNDWKTGNKGASLSELGPVSINNLGIVEGNKAKSGWIKINTLGFYTDEKTKVKQKVFLKNISFYVNEGGKNWLDFEVQGAYLNEEGGKQLAFKTEIKQVSNGVNMPVIILENGHELVPVVRSLSSIIFEEKTGSNESKSQSQGNVGKKPIDLLPAFNEELKGSNPVRVKNPNDFAVSTGLRSGPKGVNFDVPANGVQTVYVPDGRYDIFFVYSDKPDALFQGDSFTLNNNGIEIQIVQIVNGNYNIKQVK